MISSIIIPVYNQRESYLRAAVTSALIQTVPVEVVVVDDGSDCEIEPVLRDIYAHVKTDSTLVCLRQDNGGVASALNAGLEEATGEFIQWLSSDDVFLPGKTEAQAQSGGVISYCAYEEGIPAPGALWCAASYQDQETFFAALKTHCFVNACTVMWKREVFDEVGGFDPNYWHTQDLEMLLRCAERYNFIAVNEPLVRRRVHPEQMINTLKDPEQAEHKRMELDWINERFDADIQLWVPGE